MSQAHNINIVRICKHNYAPQNHEIVDFKVKPGGLDN